jgi:hypothetical protein
MGEDRKTQDRVGALVSTIAREPHPLRHPCARAGPDTAAVVSPVEQQQLEKTLGKLHRRLSELLHEADDLTAADGAAVALEVLGNKNNSADRWRLFR